MESTDGPGPTSGGSAEAFAADLPAALDVDDLQLNRLLDPLTLRSVLAVCVALAMLLRPSESDTFVVELAGLGLIGYGVTTAWHRLRIRPRQWAPVAIAVVAAVVGAVLALDPTQSIEITSRTLGVILAAGAIVDFVTSRRQGTLGLAWPLAKAVALLFLAVCTWASPGTLFEIVVTTLAVLVAIVGFVSISRSVITDHTVDTTLRETGREAIDWLLARPRSEGDRADLMRPLFFEGGDAVARFGRFIVLMCLAGVISAGGVLTDSTATVIGAMLVAPLMTPLMAITISIVMGWPNRLARAALIVAAGVLLVVLIGLVFGRIAPVTLDLTTNSQIASRSSPTIPDLIVAIAAGAAGAFGLSRADVSGALPGVAVAIALVPPLSVVGITLAANSPDDAVGALLLFASNALAIIIVGGITFVITGLTPLATLRSNQQRVRTASAAVLTLAVFVVGALALNGREISANAVEAGRANDAVRRWLEAADEGEFSVQEVTVDGEKVVVTIIGTPDDAPPSSDLQEEVARALRRDVTVNLQIRVQTSEVIDPGA